MSKKIFCLVLQNYSIISQLAYWYWYNLPILFQFPQFYLYSFVCVCVSSIQFCHLCRIMHPQPQSRHWAVPTTQGSFICPFIITSTSLPYLFPSPSPNLYKPGICPLISKYFSFQEYYINGIIQYVTFWDWLFLLRRIPLQIYPSCCIYQWSVPFTAEQYSMICMNHSLLNHSPAERHLGWF